MSREKFPSTIYVQNATVFPSNLTMIRPCQVKCGNITSGFWKFCDCHEIDIVSFTESVDKQNSGMWLSSCYQITVPNIKKIASQVFSLGLRKPILCSKIVAY